MKGLEKTGSRIKSGMTKLWDWAHTPLGDAVIMGMIMIGAMALIHWFAWALWTQGWR